MSTIYVKFKSDNELVQSDDCTTRWPDSVSCSITMSGIYNEQYTNLMIMGGDETEINNWIDSNSGKVEIISEEEGNIIGQTISPEGTIGTQLTPDGEVSVVAGLFTMSDGQTWSIVETP
jgi:hypothetical protein